MKFGSLFAGIGGFDLGFERAGMECAWQVEIDDFCQKVLTKHWPGVPKYGDIRNVGKHNLETVDLICGGFPCQPFSVAGKRRGTDDDRHLWPEMRRVISELKPTWVVGENVPGIINIFIDQAISDLEAEGYTCEAFILPACSFDAPHRRDRLFVVAYGENTRFTWRERIKGNGSAKGNKRGIDGRRSNSNDGCSDVADATIKGFSDRANRKIQQQGTKELERCSQWSTEPNVGRVAHGIPDRVDRLKSLGNAVVPQVAEFIGRMIMKVDNQL